MAYIYTVFDEDNEPIRKLYTRVELDEYLKLRPEYTYRVSKKPKREVDLSALGEAPF